MEGSPHAMKWNGKVVFHHLLSEDLPEVTAGHFLSEHLYGNGHFRVIGRVKEGEALYVVPVEVAEGYAQVLLITIGLFHLLPQVTNTCARIHDGQPVVLFPVEGNAGRVTAKLGYAWAADGDGSTGSVKFDFNNRHCSLLKAVQSYPLFPESNLCLNTGL